MCEQIELLPNGPKSTPFFKSKKEQRDWSENFTKRIKPELDDLTRRSFLSKEAAWREFMFGESE